MEEERSCVLGSPLSSREIGQDGGGASEPQSRASEQNTAWSIAVSTDRPDQRALHPRRAGLGEDGVLCAHTVRGCSLV